MLRLRVTTTFLTFVHLVRLVLLRPLLRRGGGNDDGGVLVPGEEGEEPRPLDLHLFLLILLLLLLLSLLLLLIFLLSFFFLGTVNRRVTLSTLCICLFLGNAALLVPQ
jgi:hypothetical protein